MNHYTICHLSCYSSISYILFQTFIQMLHLGEIMSGNEISMNYLPCAAPKQKRFPVITLNLPVWSQHSGYLEFANRENLHNAPSRSEPSNSNSNMCSFEKGIMEHCSGLGTVLAVLQPLPFVHLEQITSGLRLKLTGSKIAFWYNPSATSHRNITVQRFTHNDDLIGEDYLILYKEKLNWLN